MRSFMNSLVAILLVLYGAEGAGNSTEVGEARGPYKYALLSHFLYAVVSKLVVLKIVYGFILFALLYKGWHFVLWFIHYLKEKKRDAHIEIEHDYGHFGHHDYSHDYGHHDYGHHDFGHEPYQGYISSAYMKDEYYPQKKKGMYDADGSYSVKGAR